MNTRTIRVSQEAYRALKMAEAAANSRSLCYLASQAILVKYQKQPAKHSEAVNDNLPVAAQSTEAVAEFYWYYKEFIAATRGVTNFPDLDCAALGGLFGTEIAACYQLSGGFSVFFEQLAASPYLIKNGTLAYLLKPANYRRVCGGDYAPRDKRGVIDARDSDTLAYEAEKAVEESWEI